jgi:Ca2+-binding EF-hand superfamily protein
MDANRALAGFNLTQNLVQVLFSELDPHKKGYLTENDWINAFQAFNWNDQSFIELKNAIQCSF